MQGLLLSDDLMFSSRITGTAQSQGIILKVARTAAALESLAQQDPPRCVIVDLANPGLNIGDLTAKLGAGSTKPYVVAYGSHVDTATLAAAKDAGCDLVLPRSKFVTDLPTALPRWFGVE
jgi:DNA-binding NarL/FixJ family response regulator